ncbi:MAG: M48 family metallopeptidase [Deltaproteobacteria bacterium]|nr:M48 family metallopeptidase [Deltaproteobacteria bacterium]
MSDSKWQQTEFSFAGGSVEPKPAADLEAHRRRIGGYLSVLLPEPVDVVFTNNRSTMVSFRHRRGRLSVRLHRLFRHADNDLLGFLALYVAKGDSAASKKLDSFIAAHREEIQPAARSRKKPVNPRGNHHDLSVVLDRVNQTYFEGKVQVKIGWGRAPTKRRKRRGRTISRALATYSFDDRTIRVSPILDSPDVPDYVIDWIVYHEMLHDVLPVEKDGGKRRYHTHRFKVLERAFVQYEEAKAWEKKHLDKLLSLQGFD